MPLAKTIVVDSIGVPAAFHVVDNVNVSKSTKYTSAIVQSYYTQEAFNEGKQPLGMAASIAIVGVPADGEDCFEFAERMLVEAEPAEGADQSPAFTGSQNRYLFAGAEIVK